VKVTLTPLKGALALLVTVAESAEYVPPTVTLCPDPVVAATAEGVVLGGVVPPPPLVWLLLLQLVKSPTARQIKINEKLLK
jgi:hypothetical protein